MPRIVIFGNSGSGKSSLAREKSETFSCPHLDLDTIAWEEEDPPTRKSLADCESLIESSLKGQEHWVIEGCYSDLLELVLPRSTEIIFLNPGVEICIANSRNRPWEAHKYESPEAQNANLDMLIDWIKQYASRTDEFSLLSHRRLFETYQGKKTEFTSNARTAPPGNEVS